MRPNLYVVIKIITIVSHVNLQIQLPIKIILSHEKRFQITAVIIGLIHSHYWMTCQIGFVWGSNSIRSHSFLKDVNAASHSESAVPKWWMQKQAFSWIDDAISWCCGDNFQPWDLAESRTWRLNLVVWTFFSSGKHIFPSEAWGCFRIDIRGIKSVTFCDCVCVSGRDTVMGGCNRFQSFLSSFFMTEKLYPHYVIPHSLL